MSFIVVIPARYDSVRLPGKPLLPIAGKPMLQRVWEQATQSSASRIVIATDDQRIQALANRLGVEVCMTRKDHVSGTDRLQEVAMQLGFPDDQILVNVQGDEPLIPPQVIDQVAANLESHPAAGVSTLSEPIETLEDFLNPNVVKVVGNHCNFALLFTRAPVPWPRDDFIGVNKRFSDSSPAMRHIGLYAYRVGTLNQFVAWPRCEIECAESLEQLRFMYHGINIHIDTASHEVPPGVDTEDDLRRLDEVLKNEHN
ncbi:MAG: 3-deoxy-manno-octulosonate cytidylyltransferase [Porticoccaceae bacterium]|nr:3-deoxy-manno-octulosonate cytidylyltransferase [Porticoccaceae bacterium]